MKIYVAGKLGTEIEKESLEKIDSLCKSLGFETFLPHRDVGLIKNIDEVDKIFEGDILNGFKNCDAVIALLDGLHVGAGTAWELGYAYAKGIYCIGLKSDEPFDDALDYISPIILASIKKVTSFSELNEELETFKKEREKKN